ncbi:MAG: Hsp20 family protein [Bacilli bacterium]|nr:Hsp20 family protein [Bacilli bacterium]
MLISKEPFFNNYFDFFDSKNNHKFMNTDIIDKGNNYLLKIEIPGIEKQNIAIDYENENINIKVIKNEQCEENDSYVKQEICYGEYSRAFYVGKINEEEIEANYNNGILTISIPKEAKVESKKVIEIK